MKKLIAILLMLVPAITSAQEIVFDTITFVKGGSVFKLILFTDSLQINNTMYYSSFWNKNGGDIYNKNTGNVGIGTSTPLQKLHVLGTIYGVSNNGGVYGLSSSQFGVRGSSTTFCGVYGTSSSNAGVAGISSTGNGGAFSSTSGMAIWASSNSNVGVFGYTSSASKQGVYGQNEQSGGIGTYGTAALGYGVYGTGLYGVTGQSTTGIGIRGTTNSGTAGEFVAGNTGGLGLKVHSLGGNVFDFYSDKLIPTKDSNMIMLQNGFVGIGLSLPSEKLEVNGTVKMTALKVGNYTVSVTDNVSIPQTFSMTYPGSGIAVSTGSAWGSSITDNSTHWNRAYDRFFDSENGIRSQDPFSIEGDPDVGKSLTVWGGSSLYGDCVIDNGSKTTLKIGGDAADQDHEISFYSDNTKSQSIVANNNENGAFIYSANGHFWNDHTGTRFMTLTDVGNLGIGNSSPATALDVNGVITATGGTSTDWNAKVSSQWGTNVSGIHYTDGNVGIGTTNPLYQLYVQKSASSPTVVSYMNMEASATATNGNYQCLNAYVSTNASNSTNFTGTNNGGSLRNRYTITHNGSGTLTQSSVVSAMFINNGGTTTNASIIHIEPVTVASGKTLTNFMGTWVRGGAVTGILTNRYGLRIDDLVGGTNRWGISQEGTSDLNYFAGNVGIGTSTIPQKLTVNGNMEITGYQEIVKISTTPTLATSRTATYTKGNYYVIAYNDAGTMKYRYFDQTATANPPVWVYSTTAP